MTCGHGSRCGCSQIGQVAIVQKDCFNKACSRGKSQHHPVQAGQADPRIVEEAGADLDGKAVEAFNIGCFDIHFAICLRNFHRQDRRHDHSLFRQSDECLFDHINQGTAQSHLSAKFGLGHNSNVMGHSGILSPLCRQGGYPDR